MKKGKIVISYFLYTRLCKLLPFIDDARGVYTLPGESEILPSRP